MGLLLLMEELKVYAVSIPDIPLGALFVAPNQARAKNFAFNFWRSRIKHDDYINIRAQVIEWEPGWDDGEFWHPLPEGHVADTGHPYIESLWRGWPKKWPHPKATS